MNVNSKLTCKQNSINIKADIYTKNKKFKLILIKTIFNIKHTKYYGVNLKNIVNKRKQNVVRKQ